MKENNTEEQEFSQRRKISPQAIVLNFFYWHDRTSSTFKNWHAVSKRTYGEVLSFVRNLSHSYQLSKHKQNLVNMNK